MWGVSCFVFEILIALLLLVLHSCFYNVIALLLLVLHSCSCNDAPGRNKNSIAIYVCAAGTCRGSDCPNGFL